MKISKYIKAATGSPEELKSLVEDRIDELESQINLTTDIDSCDEIEADSNVEFDKATKYSNFGEFVYTSYPEFGVDEDDMDAEVLAVENAIYSYGGSPSKCPTYWRDDYEEPIVEIDGRYYFVDWRGGTRAALTPLDSPVFPDLEYYGIEACNNIMEDTDIDDAANTTYKYKLEDTFGAPQAGVDTKYFEDWYEVEEFLDNNPDVEQRISEGYATISEI